MSKPDRFEQEWRNAFDGAETPPSPALWKNIEHKLASKSNSTLKKRVFYYKYAAAASLLLALGIATVTLFQLTKNEVGQPGLDATEQMAEVQDLNDQPVDERSASQTHERLEENEAASLGTVENNDLSSRERNNDRIKNAEKNDQLVLQNEGTENNTENSAVSGAQFKDQIAEANTGQTTTEDPVLSTQAVGSDDNAVKTQEGANNASSLSKGSSLDNQKNVTDNERTDKLLHQTASALEEKENASEAALPSLNNNDGVEVLGWDQNLERVAALEVDSELGALLDRSPQMVPWYDYIPAQKSKNNTRDMWFGLAMATGRNDPNFGSGTEALVSAAESSGATADFSSGIRNLGNVSEERAGQVFQFGVDFGKQLSDKWVLLSGLNYVQRTTSQRSNITTRSDSGPNFALNNSGSFDQSSQVFITAPYQLVNEYNSVAIPLQAGYVLVDGKLNVMVQGGVANEFLLFNDIESSSAFVEDQRISGGDGNLSTYILSGQIGTEVSYKFASQYMISLSPQVRQALTSVLNAENDEGYRPRLFTVGLHFRYLLK